MSQQKKTDYVIYIFSSFLDPILQHVLNLLTFYIGVILIDDQCAPSLTTAMINHFNSVKLKKAQDEDPEMTVSDHHQCLVTKSCYHQDRDINKRKNTAAKLKPKVDGRIVQTSPEVDF